MTFIQSEDGRFSCQVVSCEVGNYKVTNAKYKPKLWERWKGKAFCDAILAKKVKAIDDEIYRGDPDPNRHYRYW